MDASNANVPLSPEAAARKTYGRLAYALLATGVSAFLLSLLAALLIEGLKAARLLPSALPGWAGWLVRFVPLYGMAFPIGCRVMRTLPAQRADPVPVRPGEFLTALLISFPLMYGGSILGVALSLFFSHGSAENPLNEVILQTSPLKVLVVVLAAPVMEELLFRKLLIDRCVQFGEKSAILCSALFFGLFHMNLFQFFYAFALGLVLGWLYVRTRSLLPCALLHAILNFWGGVVTPMVISHPAVSRLASLEPEEAAQLLEPPVQPDMLWGLFLLFGLCFLILVLCAAGILLLIRQSDKIRFAKAPREVSGRAAWKALFFSSGTAWFLLYCLGMSLINLFGL